jgi:tetratricopeptide (TPR) repeat protein
MAFVVGVRHVMTCCHVLNDALGRQRLDPVRPPPNSRFSVRFPYARNAKGSGDVALWGFELPQAKDVAVLELVEDAPADAGVATFSDAEVQREKWSCIGWDAEGIDREVDGTFGTVLARNERQLNGPATGVALTITHGYSGAAVWSDTAKAFVGMVVTKDRAHFENKLAYAIPTRVLLEVWPELLLNRAEGKAEAGTTPFEVEPPSPKFVERKALMRRMEKVLRRVRRRPPRSRPDDMHAQAAHELKGTLPASAEGARPVTRVALHGPPGSGKTKVAAAFARRAEATFPGGVLWATLGKTPDVRSILTNWGRLLGDTEIPADGYPDVPTASKSLISLLRQKACLLILDDAWDPNLVRDSFQIEGPYCLLFVTTRVRAVAEVIGAEVVDVAGMTLSEAMALLKNWAGPIAKQSREVAKSLAREVGYLPLALELVGAQVKRLGWQEYKRRWDEQKLGALKRTPHAKGKQDSVTDSIDLSVASLRDDERARFYDLAVFPDKAAFPASACAALWGSEEDAALDELLDFADCALLERRATGDRPQFIFHDLLREFVKERKKQQSGGLRSTHRALVNGYKRRCPAGWHTVPDDGYVHDRIAYHMAQAEDAAALRALLARQWFEFQERRTGSFWAAASDLETGIALAEAQGRHGLLDIVKWCYARASVGSRATGIPPRLLGALVQLGDAGRARGYAALIGTADRRASAYLRMAEAARARGEKDTAVEFAGQAHAALTAMPDSVGRIGLLSEFALIAHALGEEALVDTAVADLVREAQRDAGNEHWAVQSASAAARTLVALDRKGQAAELIRTVADKAGLDEDRIRRVVSLVRVATVLRTCGLDDEAKAVDVKAEEALERANRAIREAGGEYISMGYASDLVSALVESGDLDAALIVADRWVIGSFSVWEYPHSLALVSSALLSRGQRDEARAVVTRSLEVARKQLAAEKRLYEYSKFPGEESLAAVATALAQLGETATALEFANGLEPPESRATVLAAVAEVLARSAGSADEARSLVAECLKASQTTSSPSVAEAAALVSLAQGLARVKAETEARRAIEQAQTMLHAVEDRRWKWREAALEVVRGLALLGDVEQARSAIDSAEAGYSGAGASVDPNRVLVDQLEVADTLVEMGKLAEAKELVLEVASLEGKPVRHETSAYVLARVGHLLGRLGDDERALQHALQAKSMVQGAGRPLDTAGQGELIETIAAITGCIAAYASVDDALRWTRPDDTAHPESEARILSRAVELLWEAGDAARALDVARRLVEVAPTSRVMLVEALERAGAHAEAVEEARRSFKQVWPLNAAAGLADWQRGR